MPATLPPLLSADELAAALSGDLRILVLDATAQLEVPGDGQPYTITPDRDGHRAEHVPDAVFADVPHALSDPDGEFSIALPTPERFAAAAGALGVGDDTHVVVYDTAGGAWATARPSPPGSDPSWWPTRPRSSA